MSSECYFELNNNKNISSGYGIKIPTYVFIVLVYFIKLNKQGTLFHHYYCIHGRSVPMHCTYACLVFNNFLQKKFDRLFYKSQSKRNNVKTKRFIRDNSIQFYGIQLTRKTGKDSGEKGSEKENGEGGKENWEKRTAGKRTGMGGRIGKRRAGRRTGGENR